MDVSALTNLLFASPKAIARIQLVELLSISAEELATQEVFLKEQLAKLGLALAVIDDALQIRTAPQYAELIKKMREPKAKRLSMQALETLAIIAYRQPIVRSDIERIRGVDAAPTIKTLLDRNLVKIVGHSDAPGQPAVLGTTEQFLELFGLSTLSELPSLRDIGEFQIEEPQEKPQEKRQETGSQQQNIAVNPA